MPTKIALIRGINVGGHRKILMSELKSMLASLGLTDIKTYIQSGNVIFKSNTDNLELEQVIGSKIQDRFGFSVPVLGRSSAEWQQTINENPFQTNSDINQLHVSFQKTVPDQENKQAIEAHNYDPDQFKIIGKDIFIFCAGKYHESKLTNYFFEKKLKVGVTTRNWKTVLKLNELRKV